jgi:lipopolysaccharide export system permease protein
MRLISRHILRTMVVPFIWGVVALTGMLLLNALPPLIDRFGGRGIDFRTIANGILYLTPSITMLTLPMAVLVSVLYGYSQLAASLEMVAMYANGISVWRMTRPALIGAAAVAMVNFYVVDQVSPRSNVRLANLLTAVQEKLPTLALRQRVLNVLPGRTGYILRADVINPDDGGMRHVTIFDLTDNADQARRLILADSGTMAETVDGKNLVLSLHSGEIYEFKPNEPGQLQQINFVDNTVMVRDVQNSLDLAVNGRLRSEREMTGCELLDSLQEHRWAASRAREESEYYTRNDLHALAGLPPLARPAELPHPKIKEYCGMVGRLQSWARGIVTPQKLRAQEPPQNPVPPPVQQGPKPVPQVPTPAPQVPTPALLGPQNPVVAQPLAQNFLVPPPGQTAGMLTPYWNVLNDELKVTMAQSATYLYEVQFHQEFAIPLACFCFVLIGMSLALKYPGGGIGLVIGGSLVIFLGFYILLLGGKGIAITGRLNPAVAMYVPLLLFTLIGVFAVNSANREMGTSRSGGLLDTLMGLFQGGQD